MQSDAKRGRKPVCDATVNAVNELFSYNLNTSVRQAAQSVPVSKSSVHKIVKNNLKLYPYKIQLDKAIKPGDYEKREQFARTLLTNVEQDPAYLSIIFFTAEATFHISGVVNRHNSRIWRAENPHVFHEVERNTAKVHVGHSTGLSTPVLR